MKFMVLIYTDDTLMEALPEGQFETMMRGCLAYADQLRREGRLLDSQMLESPATAKALRTRNGRLTTIDGPFAEAKELLGGFNLIEARDMEEALEIAAHFPWSRTGRVEVRPVMDMDVMRRRVGADASDHEAHRAAAEVAEPA